MTPHPALRKEPAIFYGWWIVAAVFVMNTTTSGLAFYNLSVFLNAFAVEGGFSVGAVSGATAVYFFSSGFGGMAVAQLMLRIEPRVVMASGGAICAIALLMIPFISEIWQVYLFFALFGIGNAGCGMVPGTWTVARWFAKRRPLAMSLATTGLSVGGIVLTPMSALLVAGLGIAAAAPWISALFFVLVAGAALPVRRDPESMGLEADGAAPEPDEPHSSGTGARFQDAVRSRFFILLAFANLLSLSARVGAVAHQFGLATRTVDAAAAASSVAVVAGSAAIARLIGGWVLGHVSIRAFTLLMLAVQAAGVLLLGLAEGTGSLLLGSAIFGIAMGNLVMVNPLVFAEAFGLRDYGRIFSLGQLIGTFGSAGGPLAIGLLFDLSGGYFVSYMAGAAASALAVVLFAAAGPVGRR